MSHPISNLIRQVENGTVPSNANEQIYYVDTNKNSISTKPPGLFSYFKTIATYITNNRNTAKGSFSFIWENLQRESLKLKVIYTCRCSAGEQNQLIQALMDSASIGLAFDRLLKEICDEFYEEQVEHQVDPVNDFLKVDANNQTLKTHLASYVKTEIENITGLNVRQLSIQLDHGIELEDITIETLDPLQTQSKSLSSPINYKYKIILKAPESAERIYAITRHQESATFQNKINQAINDYLLDHFSYHTYTSNKKQLIDALSTVINKQFLYYGRKVKYLQFDIEGIKQREHTDLDMMVFEVRSFIEGSREEITVSNKITASVIDYGKFESIENQYESWIMEQLKRIIENQVLGFKDYKDIILDQYTKREFIQDIKIRLSQKVLSKGIQLDDYTAKIISDFQLPDITEPIHHEVACTVKKSTIPITFGSTIFIRVFDKEKYIKNFNENSLKNWLRKKLDEIIKGVIEFRDYRQLVLESIPIKNGGVLEDNNYKNQIETRIEQAADTIGCEVEQLLIEPRLSPLEWLNEFQLNIVNRAFKTMEDGIPIKASIKINCKITDLAALNNELLSPTASIEPIVIRAIENVIAQKLLKTSSERAYLEFYESNVGEVSVEEELKEAITTELKRKFTAKVSYIDIQPVSTPLLELYQALKGRDNKAVFTITNIRASENVPYVLNYEITGVANWNNFKIKCTEATDTINRINASLEDAIKKKLERTDLKDLLANSAFAQDKIEALIGGYAIKIIAERYGLYINVLDFFRQRTHGEGILLENKRQNELNQGKILQDNTTQILLDEGKQKNGLLTEKENLEVKVKYGAASKEDKKRLKEITEQLQKSSPSANLLNTNQLDREEAGSSLDDLFNFSEESKTLNQDNNE